MVTQKDQFRILVSIHPRYAEQILLGNKTVEFRKQKFSKSISEIYFYQTAPIHSIDFSAEVLAVIYDNPKNLWRKFRATSGIDRIQFEKYYDGKNVGTAILLSEVRRFNRPKKIESIIPSGLPPQSFIYF